MTMIDSAYLIRFFRLAADRMEEARQHLCSLDGEVGDGDHGTSMANGFGAIAAGLRDAGDKPPDRLLRDAAQAFLAEVGATVGPLYATALLTASRRFGEDQPSLDERDLPLLLGDMADGIEQRGRAGSGDKTMLDAWRPAVQAATDAAVSGASAADIARAAAIAAAKGAEATATMIASRGRAARLKERSLGHIDPGAASAAILIAVFADLAGDRP